jgi:hypothetical protein
MDIPRLATLEQDYWELESGEARHAEAPKTFWIPPRKERESLEVGTGVKLLFIIETEDESGIERCVERMWVIIKRRLPGIYIGVLDSEPATFEPEPEFLAKGAEIVFKTEHIIDISKPSREYIIKEYRANFLSVDAG